MYIQSFSLCPDVTFGVPCMQPQSKEDAETAWARILDWTAVLEAAGLDADGMPTVPTEQSCNSQSTMGDTRDAEMGAGIDDMGADMDAWPESPRYALHMSMFVTPV